MKTSVPWSSIIGCVTFFEKKNLPKRFHPETWYILERFQRCLKIIKNKYWCYPLLSIADVRSHPPRGTWIVAAWEDAPPSAPSPALPSRPPEAHGGKKHGDLGKSPVLGQVLAWFFRWFVSASTSVFDCDMDSPLSLQATYHYAVAPLPPWPHSEPASALEARSFLAFLAPAPSPPQVTNPLDRKKQTPLGQFIPSEASPCQVDALIVSFFCKVKCWMLKLNSLECLSYLFQGLPIPPSSSRTRLPFPPPRCSRRCVSFLPRWSQLHASVPSSWSWNGPVGSAGYLFQSSIYI